MVWSKAYFIDRLHGLLLSHVWAIPDTLLRTLFTRCILALRTGSTDSSESTSFFDKDSVSEPNSGSSFWAKGLFFSSVPGVGLLSGLVLIVAGLEIESQNCTRNRRTLLGLRAEEFKITAER